MPLFSEAENAALALADELTERPKASAETLAAAHAHLGDAATQELVLVAGIYLLVCRYLETLEIDLEEEEIPVSGLEEIRNGVSALRK